MPLLPQTRKLLDKFSSDAVNKMKQNSRKYKASGEMERGFEAKNTEYGVVIWGVEYVEWIEQGRGATDTTTPSQPTLAERLVDWLKVKKIPLWKDARGRFIPRSTQAYVIARKIHRDGVSWYGKTPRVVYSDIINDRTLDAFANEVSKTQEISIGSDITNIFESILTTGFTE